MIGVHTDENKNRQYLPQPADNRFETLYNRYVDQVYRQCLSMTKDSEKAQDFTHDIFIKVFDNLDSFRQRSSFSTWIYAIAYNYCADQIRLAKRLPTAALDEQLDDHLADTEEAMTQEEAIQLAYEALSTLSPTDQVLLRQKYEEGLSLEELAKLHRLSISAVKMRLKRGREKIQHFYANRWAS
ncbi:RNA polymerase sigma factor [Spirosoma sp.]|uniref:RNA polymerase sigma factor n=1 Tax=Spirosoma sp. TaxID=1899569 RepID=UPI003B3BBED5